MEYRNTNIIQEFMEHIRNYDTEEFIKGILFCFGATTIKGIKAACLINFRRRYDENMRLSWKLNADKWLKPLNVQWILLNEHYNYESKNALVLIYRRELLARALGCEGACKILRSCGYPLPDLDACLKCLREKIGGEFPHEIGLFLDYPPDDVKCFMENKKCENQLRNGYWKVYGNVSKAKQIFSEYRQAEYDAARLIMAGK